MDLRSTVAAPFQRAGREHVNEGEFVVALSLERDWFSPDQAKRVVDLAVADGLLRREDGELYVEFDPASVTVPPGETPSDDVLRQQSPFERVLGTLIADGADKQSTVASINRLQSELAITVDAAAILYARSEGYAVDDAARAARKGIVGNTEDGA